MHTSFVRSFVRLLTCAHPHRVHREDINYSMEGKLTTCIHLNSLRRGLVNFFNTFCATSNNQVYAIARYSSLHFNSNHWSLFGGYSGGFFFLLPRRLLLRLRKVYLSILSILVTIRFDCHYWRYLCGMLCVFENGTFTWAYRSHSRPYDFRYDERKWLWLLLDKCIYPSTINSRKQLPSPFAYEMFNVKTIGLFSQINECLLRAYDRMSAWMIKRRRAATLWQKSESNVFWAHLLGFSFFPFYLLPTRLFGAYVKCQPMANPNLAEYASKYSRLRFSDKIVETARYMAKAIAFEGIIYTRRTSE